MALRLDGLDHPVLAPRHGPEAVSETPDGLVVHRLHHELRAVEQVRKAAGRIESHRVRHGLQLRRAVHDQIAELIGDVCDEVPAQGDVQELHAAADAEDGQPGTRQSGARQRQLETIPLLRDAVVGVVVSAAVVRRIDVPTAGQDQPGNRVEPLRGLALDGRKDHRDAARHADGVDVLARDGERLPLSGPSVARYPDQGSHDR